jgi:hypothetical protein
MGQGSKIRLTDTCVDPAIVCHFSRCLALLPANKGFLSGSIAYAFPGPTLSYQQQHILTHFHGGAAAGAAAGGAAAATIATA